MIAGICVALVVVAAAIGKVMTAMFNANDATVGTDQAYVAMNGTAAPTGSAAPVSTPTPTPATPAPTTPAGLTATAGSGNIALNWNDVANASSYTVTGCGATFTTLVSSGTCSGLTNGTTYNVTVTATGPGGTSTAATATATPVAPPLHAHRADSHGHQRHDRPQLERRHQRHVVHRHRLRRDVHHRRVQRHLHGTDERHQLQHLRDGHGCRGDLGRGHHDGLARRASDHAHRPRRHAERRDDHAQLGRRAERDVVRRHVHRSDQRHDLQRVRDRHGRRRNLGRGHGQRCAGDAVKKGGSKYTATVGWTSNYSPTTGYTYSSCSVSPATTGVSCDYSNGSRGASDALTLSTLSTAPSGSVVTLTWTFTTGGRNPKTYTESEVFVIS